MTKQKHILIDGDALVYRSCTTQEVATAEESCDYFDSIVDWILWQLQDFPDDKSYTIFLSGHKNYRKLLYPDYKANREGNVKPENFNEVYNHCKDNWNTVICNGYEADDGISMDCHKRGFKNVVIVSSDKDFKQLPVEIFNTYHWKRYTVTKAEARKNFWTQVLTGDSIDNIKGCKGIGPRKAEKILNGCKTEEDYVKLVQETFNDSDAYAKAYTLVKLLSNYKEYESYVNV